MTADSSSPTPSPAASSSAPAPAPAPPPRRILVTGDAGPDIDAYLHFTGPNPPPGTKPTRLRRMLGGAGLALRILSEWVNPKARAADTPSPAAVPAVEIGFLPPPQETSPIFALWNRKPLDGRFKGKDRSTDIKQVWRLVQSVNPGALAEEESFKVQKYVMPTGVASDFRPDIVLIQDDAATFRHPRGKDLPVSPFWKREDGKGVAAAESPFLIWKMSPPFCRGDLWWKAVEAGVLDRTLVVVRLTDLRNSPVRISCGISWERTALETARELEYNPALADLRRAAHVVVVIHGEGALWRRRVSNAQETPAEFTLFFDARHMERESCRTSEEDISAYGYTTVFASALAAGLARATDDTRRAALRDAIPRGLHAMRLLHVYGHGPGEPAPDFPLKEIVSFFPDAKPASSASAGAGEIGETGGTGEASKTPPATEKTKAKAAVDRIAGLSNDIFCEFGQAKLPLEEVKNPESRWALALNDPYRPPDEPLYGLARRVAVFGESQLRAIPHARFKKLLTADRNEIEALRNLKTLMSEYRKNDQITKPLSLAVFGPPGSGKSFGVTQIAEEVFGEQGAFLEFNLSQFTEDELAGAFHQVRDKALQGKIPVVFWDEFDSSGFKWLKLLLAPMNDGKFQEGQLTHPLGRCVFVFAGGTSPNRKEFGVEPPIRDEHGCIDETQSEAWEKWKLLKGPDFLSRLHGTLDVLGPNPPATPQAPACGKTDTDAELTPGTEAMTGTPKEVGAKVTPESSANDTDFGFPLRRALLLRTRLKMKPDQRLRMDPGLLSALLEVSKYTDGARSMEKICNSLIANAPKDGPYMPSHLPNDAVLAMNVRDLGEFKAILSEDQVFQKHAQLLAAAVHARWLKHDERGSIFLQEFEKLDPEAQGDNYEAVKRIPFILAFSGLRMKWVGKNSPHLTRSYEYPPGINKTLEEHVELLASEEHEGWREVRAANGWVVTEPTADKELRKKLQRGKKHSCMIDYKDLHPSDKEKDRAAILWYPTLAELAGFQIVFRSVR